MAPFTRQVRDAMIRSVIHSVETKEEIKTREYWAFRKFHEDLNVFIERYPHLPGIDDVAKDGLTLFSRLQQILDRHFLEYQEKLATFKAASTAVTAIPLAEEVLRIAIVRNFNLGFVIARLWVAVAAVIDPRTKNTSSLDPLTQMANALSVAREELRSMVNQHQTVPFDDVLRMALEFRRLNCHQLFLDWLDYRKYMNGIEHMS